jgi:hypothetical protein
VSLSTPPYPPGGPHAEPNCTGDKQDTQELKAGRVINFSVDKAEDAECEKDEDQEELEKGFHTDSLSSRYARRYSRNVPELPSARLSRRRHYSCPLVRHNLSRR